MSGHTPGPWRILPNYPGDGRWNISTDNGVVEKVIVAPDDGWNSSYTEFTEREANARLIAAAPELLAACLLVLGHLNGSTGEVDAVAILDAAIAKAEGR